MQPDITIVLIGLNVERFLPDCLASIRRCCWPSERLERLYVDSGSSDSSRAIVGAEPGWQVLDLEDPRPSVAKGRNMGIRHASSALVQLLDADMLLEPEWLDLGWRLMQEDPKLAAVFGRTIERYPDRNCYHAMRNAIWSMHAVGAARRLPGASLLRVEAVQRCALHRTSVRGFEDVELAQRLCEAGYRLLGRPEIMCRHDSDMHCFRQYWRSNVRGGQGNYDILRCTRGRTRRLFLRELRRSVFWPMALAAGLAASVMLRQPAPAIVSLTAFAAATLREVRRGWRTGGTAGTGLAWAGHWILSKVPYSVGFLSAYWADRSARQGG